MDFTPGSDNRKIILLMPIQKIDSTGIYSQLQGKTINFEFITQPYTKGLDQIRDLISFKQNQINFIQKEVSFLTTEQRLNQSAFQQKIKLIEKEFQTEVCGTIPNAFWNRKKYTVTLPYEPDFDEKYIPTRELSIRKSVVHFAIRFSIPWIWKWDFACDYQESIPRLKRIYFVKWWDKMDLKDLIPKIQQHAKACWFETTIIIDQGLIHSL